MSNDNQLMTHQPQAMAQHGMMAWGPQRLDGALKFAETLLRGGLLPSAYKNPGAVLTAMILGEELGMTPMMAVRGIHVISGRPTLSAEMMVALVKRRPDVCKYFIIKESSETKATYETLRVGDPQPTTLTFTIDMAKTAGLLSNPTWKKHPAPMLRARASSALARAVYPDLVGGLYDHDEGAEIAGMYDAPPQRQPSQRPQPQPQPPHPAVSRVQDVIPDAEVIGEQSANPRQAIIDAVKAKGWGAQDLDAFMRHIKAPQSFEAMEGDELAGFADYFLDRGIGEMEAWIAKAAAQLTGGTPQ